MFAAFTAGFSPPLMPPVSSEAAEIVAVSPGVPVAVSENRPICTVVEPSPTFGGGGNEGGMNVVETAEIVPGN
ncbi:MAG: hypothetical protein Fues2KO_37110 [Fuerstiella sp.]